MTGSQHAGVGAACTYGPSKLEDACGQRRSALHCSGFSRSHHDRPEFWKSPLAGLRAKVLASTSCIRYTDSGKDPGQDTYSASQPLGSIFPQAFGNAAGCHTISCPVRVSCFQLLEHKRFFAMYQQQYICSGIIVLATLQCYTAIHAAHTRNDHECAPTAAQCLPTACPAPIGGLE